MLEIDFYIPAAYVGITVIILIAILVKSFI